MPWQKQAMKDVASCDKLREPQAGIDPEISEWETHGGEPSVRPR